MPDVVLPRPEEGENTKETINNLLDAYFKIKKELEYILNNLDNTNISANYIYAGTLEADQIITGTLDAGKISVINLDAINIHTQNLYAEKGYISELTVDQLDTSTKVQKYLLSDTSDCNYFKIYEQNVEFITASTDGLSDVQATNRFGTPLYWVDEFKKFTTTEATSYPVMIYVYTEVVKLKLSFVDVDGVYTPKIELGQGVGVEGHPEYGKAYIWKDVVGLRMEYISSTGVVKAFSIDDTSPKIPCVSANPISFWTGTQTEYDAISTPDANTLYFIKGA